MISRTQRPIFSRGVIWYSHNVEEKIFKIKEDQLESFVRELLVLVRPNSDAATVIALYGDLGAGKTTFVKTLGRALGVTEHITSPTFTIMSRYETDDQVWEALVHMDAYRIDDGAELAPLRFEELLHTPNTLFCIEWADKIEEALPANYLQLHFSNTNDPATRTIRISQ